MDASGQSFGASPPSPLLGAAPYRAGADGRNVVRL